MRNIVLLLTGSSYQDQKKVEDLIFQSGVNFGSINLSAIFHQVAEEITLEYFSKEMQKTNEISGLSFINYLDLLNFLQKTDDPALCKIYKNVYLRAQIANEIIIFRLYKQCYIACKKIIDSGSSCIFFENIFSDPYPRRKEIFFDYFKSFGESLKIINIYTDLKTTLLQVKENNEKFIKFFLKDNPIRKSYLDLIYKSREGNKDLPRIENPLFNFEIYLLMHNLTTDKNTICGSFDTINSDDIYNIYEECVLEMKKFFGFLALKSFPIFYPKISILNDIGPSFLYVKNFPLNTKLYINNNRVICDLRININQDNWVEPLKSFLQKIFGQQLRFRSENNNNRYIGGLIENRTNTLTKDISMVKINKVKDLLVSNVVFFDCSLLNSMDSTFNKNKILSIEPFTYNYFFVSKKEGWDAFVMILHKNGKVKIYSSVQYISNFVFINDLYLSLYAIKGKHFFIKEIPLNRFEKFKIIKNCLNILNYDRRSARP